MGTILTSHNAGVPLRDNIALRIGLPPEELERASLHLFLDHQLRLIESQRLTLARRYGVNTIAELDQLAHNGGLREAEAFEDYFELDYLESQRRMLLDALQEIA